MMAPNHPTLISLAAMDKDQLLGYRQEVREMWLDSWGKSSDAYKARIDLVDAILEDRKQPIPDPRETERTS